MKTNDSVAMLALNGDRYIEYFCGVPWGGGILNPCNTRWSVGELAYSIGDAGSRILIVDEQFKGVAEKLREGNCNIDHVIYCGDGETPPGMFSYEKLVATTAPVSDTLRKGDDLLGIFYTGGTTGFPKGVMLTHGNVWSAALQILCEGLYPKGAIALDVAPMFHIAGMGTTYASLIRGNTHVVLPTFVPAVVLQTIEKHKVTDVGLVPTMIQMLVDYPEFGKYNVESLKHVMYGASPISEGVLTRALAGFPGTEFVQGYGQTELAGVCTLLGCEYHTMEGMKHGKLRSAGCPSLCVELRIVDDGGNDVTRGTTGEVVVRGPNVMAGYWQKPAETAGVFTKDGWLRTGDCAYMDDEGFVFIVDRLKDMIVSGGENVYSVEVESAISTHPAVAQCAVIGIPSAQWGEAVHAVVVLKENAEAAEDDIKSHCKKRIAGYKCPQSIEFRQELPISGAGKVLKRNLREPFWRDQTRRVA
jgi:acyl-CoA synthetase (AMP-forming)/AMP-acid ligase II